MVRRAFDLLRVHGYASEFDPGFFADLLLRHDIEYALRRDGPGFALMVELHWGVLGAAKGKNISRINFGPMHIPRQSLMRRHTRLARNGRFFFLAAHAARHHWRALKWLVDLHELYSAPKFDWEKLNTKANQLGWEELLRISFLACHSLFETPIPKKYLVGDLPAWVKLFPEVASVHRSETFFPTRLMQSPLDKLRYAARVLLIPTGRAPSRRAARLSCVSLLSAPPAPASL